MPRKCKWVKKLIDKISRFVFYLQYNVKFLIFKGTILQVLFSARASDRHIRDNSEILDRLRSDVRRHSDRIRTLESNEQEHTIARNDLQQVSS